MKIQSAFTLLSVASTAIAAVASNAIYNGNGTADDFAPISLRIGNGGAGQSGLVGALANAFIQQSVESGSPPFRIAWITSDNTQTIDYLASGEVDVGITYVPMSEQIAINKGIALNASYYIFRDHFLLVGPPSNPASISTLDDIETTFSNLFAAANTVTTGLPTRFLSRYDKTFTNIKESSIWLNIGQAPWATAYSTWYHQYIASPVQALTAAIILQEYTLTDRETYLSLSAGLASQTSIYKAAADNDADVLLNPAHLLIGAKAQNTDLAQLFADWCVSSAGQQVITSFQINGKQLYSGAPS